jgi:hypothetical protein
MNVEQGAAKQGGVSFGMLAFIAAAVGGVWLLISIWRGGK